MSEFHTRRIALVALLVAPISAWSQGAGSIRGVVVDSADRSPIPAAQVRLIEARRVDVSHEDGAFEFDNVAPGTYALVVQRVGYRPRTLTLEVRAGQQHTVRVAMTAAAVQLTPTVVTGAVSERSGREVLSATSVVSGTALDRQGAPTVAGVLLNQPGVATTSLGPSTARPVIRGLGGDRILMLEDGQRPGDLSALSGDHAVAIEPATAKQIEVVRGPMSLLYGSSALGGVVNVVREEIPTSAPDKVHGAFVLDGTSVSRGVAVSGYGVGALGPVATRIEGAARRSQDIRTPLGALENTDAGTYSGSVAASVVRDGGHAGASYRVYRSRYGLPGGFIGGHEDGVNVEMMRHTERVEAERTQALGPFTSIRAAGVFTQYDHRELEESGEVGTEFNQWQNVGEVVARHGAAGPLVSGALGVRAQYRDIITGGSLRTPSTTDYSLAGFVVEEIGRSDLRGQVGLRYDYARYDPRGNASVFVGGVRVPVRARSFGAVSGSVGVLYDWREVLHFGASVNRAYRTPDFNELYSNGPHLAANSFDVGDPRLRQETGLGVDAFARIDREGLHAEVSLFRNQLDDFIFPSSRGRVELGAQGQRPRFQYTNEDAVFLGGEGQVEWSPTRRWVIDAVVSYVRAEFGSRRAPIPVIDGLDTSFVAASQAPPFIPPLNGSLGVRYDRPRSLWGITLRFAERQNRVGDFETPTAGYAVVSANAGWRILSGSRLHTVTLRLDNAFDRVYRDHLSRIKTIMPEPGVGLYAVYRLAF